MLLPEWLERVSALTVTAHVVHLVGVSTRAKVRACDTLVRVRGLLDDDLLVTRLAAAAAHGDEPEEARADGESDTDPQNGEHLVRHGGLDVVGLEDGMEDTSESAIESGRSGSRRDDENGLSLEVISALNAKNGGASKRNSQSKRWL